MLKHFTSEFAQNQKQEKALIFENEKYQKAPNNHKMLVGIEVAAALGSDTCTQMWTKIVKQNVITKEEIVEVMQFAPYMKQATDNNTIENSF